MKNKRIVASIFFIIFVLFVLLCSKLYMNMKYIRENELKEIVFFQTNSTERDVSDYLCKKEIDENGKLTFKISFSDSQGVYSFILDGKDGKIIEYSKLKHGESLPEIFETSKQVSN